MSPCAKNDGGLDARVDASGMSSALGCPDELVCVAPQGVYICERPAFSKQPRAHTFVSDKAAWEPINDTLPAFSEWASKAVLDQPGTRQAVHAR